MRIEDFILKSEGTWKSMRSGHSLAFQQFENILSQIKIELCSNKDAEVEEVLSQISTFQGETCLPFKISWYSESDWETDHKSKGSCLLIPFKNNEQSGIFIRSKGYTEPIPTISNYKLLSNEILCIKTKYKQSISEEKIWFISDNVRCRSSVVRTSKGSGILQTSFASEIRTINT